MATDNSELVTTEYSAPAKAESTDPHDSNSCAIWHGQYCSVPLCTHSSGEQAERKQLMNERISFHSFPDLQTDKERARQWITKIKRDPGVNFVINTNTKICSKHFTPEDFVYGGGIPLAPRRLLKKTAVPSIFPWSNLPKFQRTTITSQSALGQVKHQEETSIEAASDAESSAKCEYSVELDTVISDPNFDSAPEQLHEKITELTSQLIALQSQLDKSMFRLEKIKKDDDLVHFYTGFYNYDTLYTFYKTVLEADAKVMRQWRSGESKDSYADIKIGRNVKLPLLEQFFLTMVRLRLGLLELDLAVRFDLSQPSVSRITMTWINLLYHSLKSLECYPPWHIVRKYMPQVFKEEYPNTRLIIDATEFGIERPSSLVSQAGTFSSYKNKNTVKVLIGIIPSGAIVFISPTYEGSISDKKLVQLSGLLEKLEVGDEVMADKGFDIQDVLAPLGVRLNIPPFLSSNSQFSCEDVLKTKKIAKLRIHVERAIGRIKEFRILNSTIPATMWDSLNELIYVCAMLCNFSPPLVC